MLYAFTYIHMYVAYVVFKLHRKRVFDLGDIVKMICVKILLKVENKMYDLTKGN